MRIGEFFSERMSEKVVSERDNMVGDLQMVSDEAILDVTNSEIEENSFIEHGVGQLDGMKDGENGDKVERGENGNDENGLEIAMSSGYNKRNEGLVKGVLVWSSSQVRYYQRRKRIIRTENAIADDGVEREDDNSEEVSLLQMQIGDIMFVENFEKVTAAQVI